MFISDPEVISSSSDKAKLFAINFVSSSTLDDQSYPLSDFNPLNLDSGNFQNHQKH